MKEIMLDKKFGTAGNEMVIEEFMTGREVSVLSFVDGKTIKTMTSAQDHKRAGDGDTGLNTGGMGTFSPSPFYTKEVEEFCEKYVYQATVDAMAAEGRPFKGVIFFGLMLTEDGPKVLEYNARFGDPEAQVVLPRMKNDILEVMEACIDGRQCSSLCRTCIRRISGKLRERLPYHRTGRVQEARRILLLPCRNKIQRRSDRDKRRTCSWRDSEGKRSERSPCECICSNRVGKL